jgi:cAMP-dependent protein kinase regulator
MYFFSFSQTSSRYGTPRAASVKCVTNTIVWAIDRLTFRKIIMGRTVEKRTVYSQFLKNVKILASLNDYETQTLADALQPKNFNKGDQIVKQGEEGFSFFIITGLLLLKIKNRRRSFGLEIFRWKKS